MQGRCFYCSSPEHWANACPVKLAHKAEDKAQGHQQLLDPASAKEAKGKGRGRGSAKAGAKAKTFEIEATQPATPKVAAAGSQAVEGAPVPDGGGRPALGPSQAQLVHEATEVLRSLRLKKVMDPGSMVHRVRQLSDSEGYGLVDSGATSALRQGTPSEIARTCPGAAGSGIRFHVRECPGDSPYEGSGSTNPAYGSVA